jgi:pyruvate,water dikinase
VARFCIPLEEVGLGNLEQVGGKAASLGEMIRELAVLRVPVPPGFAVTSEAYAALLDQSELRLRLTEALVGLDASDPDDIARRGHLARDMIRQAGIPKDVADEVTGAYARLEQEYGKAVDVAVRSSATAEDLPDASFAGQQASFLNVRGAAAVVDACLDCFASLFTDRAIAYRESKGFNHFSVRGAIAVQRMVRSDRGSAGVIFTLDPETGFRDVVLITGAWGLGESVVGGRVDPDEITVFKPTLGTSPKPILRHEIGLKQTRMVYATGTHRTTRTVPVAVADQRRMCLSDEDALRLAGWAVAIEDHYTAARGEPTPMDIEWAKDGTTGELWVVQARPETVHARRDRRSLERSLLLSKPPPPILEGTAVGRDVASGRVRRIRDVSKLGELRDGEVLVADMTDPDWGPGMRRAAAIVTNRGGRTCHAAIVSRELGVPCIVGTGEATARLMDGQTVTVSCVDGVGQVFDGEVPFEKQSIDIDALPKTRTAIMVNLADPDRALAHADLPVQGVGLARQEFIIANHVRVHPLAFTRYDELDGDEQVQIDELTRGYPDRPSYFVEKLAEGIGMLGAAFHPRRVIVRLGDFKSSEYAGLLGGRHFEPHEQNPMIGLRGAARYIHPRFREAFDLECRALVRVRQDMGLTNVQLMVPFCRTAREGEAVLVALAKNGLARGEDGLEVWMMCEVPSNVAAIDTFIEKFDGYSIGSNDLTQLVLGIDRDSELLAESFDETDPAVMRTIQAAIEGCHRFGRPVGICGQRPSDDPEFARFLVDEKIDSISVTPDAVLQTLRVVAAAEKETR